MNYTKEKLQLLFNSRKQKIKRLNKEIEKLTYYTKENKILTITVITALTLLFTTITSISLLAKYNLPLLIHQIIPLLASITLGEVLGNLYINKKIKDLNNTKVIVPNNYKDLEKELTKKEIEKEKNTNQNEITKELINYNNNPINNQNNKNDLIININILNEKLEKENKLIDTISQEKILKNNYKNINNKIDIINNTILSTLHTFAVLCIFSNLPTIIISIKNATLYSPIKLLTIPIIGAISSIPISYNIFKTKYNAKKELEKELNIKETNNKQHLQESIKKSIDLSKKIIDKKQALEEITTKEKESSNNYSYTNTHKEINNQKNEKGRIKILKL